MNFLTGYRSIFVAALLFSLLQPFTAVRADKARTWTIFGVEIDDAVLFDKEYIQQTIEDSKSAVIENINYETIDEEVHRIDVEPVIFSDIYIPEQRFMGFPIVCGKYRSSKSELVYRYVFLGTTPFTFVEERSKDFESSWNKYCARA